ncbi:MAG: class I SAM-dependent methyltransferase [Geminicoccaceae bacterium]
MSTVVTHPADVARRMERIYRPQRLIYDATRRYYLIGRDRLLAGIEAAPGESVLEVGCGTGRNLVHLARLYPQAQLIGVEPSPAMLQTAARALQRHQVDATLLQGTAETLSASALGRPGGLDHVVFSYVLSMVDEPAAAVDRALALLRPGGMLHIVDFGDLAGLPPSAAALLRTWLRWFEVNPRPDAGRRLAALTAAGTGTLGRQRLGRGYAELLRFRLA